MQSDHFIKKIIYFDSFGELLLGKYFKCPSILLDSMENLDLGSLWKKSEN